MSLPVDSVGPLVGSEWISAHAFPHDLRRSGWLYLRCEGSLGARVKAKKVEWRDERPVPGSDDGGSGMVIIVDPATWDDSIDISLGELAGRQIKGYRYLKADDEGEVVHYSGGKPVVFADPEDDLDEDD